VRNAFAADNDRHFNQYRHGQSNPAAAEHRRRAFPGLEVDGTVIKRVTEISGLKIDQEMVELKRNTADGKSVVKK
jgi:hypothetical protein